MAQLQERAGQIKKGAPRSSRARLLKQAASAKSVQKRVLWLHQEADLVGVAAAGVVPCKPGCSHCCYIAVLIAEPEAMVIGRAIG